MSEPNPQDYRALDAMMGQYHVAGAAPGLVYGLAGADGLEHSAGFGVSTLDGPLPTADTIFPIASMSKSFVAAAALAARDADRLALSDPITKYIPEFSVSNADLAVEGVPTLGMLLSMCGGLTEDNSWVDPFIDRPIDDLLAQMSDGVRLSRYPGAAWEYSNLGFTLAGLAVARAVDQRLEDYVHDTLFAPLGLTSTFFDNALPAGTPRAIGYTRTDDEWRAFEPQRSAAFAGAGGIVSTVRDLARWITWLGAAYRPRRDDDVDVLSRMSRREMQRIHVSIPPALAIRPDGALLSAVMGYGLGLVTHSDLRHGDLISHAGGLPGFRSFMIWHPTTGHGAIVLTNSQDGDPFTPCGQALNLTLRQRQAPMTTIDLWPETMRLRAAADRLVRDWDDTLAEEIFAGNVAFEQPLAARREQLEALLADVGPIVGGARTDIVSAATPADVTWSIPTEHGELLCMIHLTPVEPARIQQFVVQAARGPRATRPRDISPARAGLVEAGLTPLANIGIAEASLTASVD